MTLTVQQIDLAVSSATTVTEKLAQDHSDSSSIVSTSTAVNAWASAYVEKQTQAVFSNGFSGSTISQSSGDILRVGRVVNQRSLTIGQGVHINFNGVKVPRNTIGVELENTVYVATQSTNESLEMSGSDVTVGQPKSGYTLADFIRDSNENNMQSDENKSAIFSAMRSYVPKKNKTDFLATYIGIHQVLKISDFIKLFEHVMTTDQKHVAELASKKKKEETAKSLSQKQEVHHRASFESNKVMKGIYKHVNLTL